MPILGLGYIYKIDGTRSHYFPYWWTSFEGGGPENRMLFDISGNFPNKKHWHYIIHSLLEE